MNDILRIAISLTVWVASFSAVYGVEGLVCSDHWSAADLSLNHGRITLVAVWSVAVVLQVMLLAALRGSRFRSPLPWMQRLSVSLAWVALVATLWSLMPILTTSLCL